MVTILQAMVIATQIIIYGLIRDLVPRKYIPVSLGSMAAGLGLSTVMAPLFGDWLVDHHGWRGILWFLAIYTLVMTPLVILVVVKSPLRVRDRVDPAGAVLVSAGVLLTLLYLNKGQDWGWGSPTSLACLLGGLAALVALFVVEGRIDTPLMDMKLLAQPKVVLVLLMTFFGVGITAFHGYALGSMSRTPDIEGMKSVVAQEAAARAHQAGVNLPPSAVQIAFDPGYSYGSGFSMTAFIVHLGMWVGVATLVFGLIGGWLAHRHGARIPAIIGLTVLAVLGVCFAWISDGHYSWERLLVSTLLFGVGFGFFYAGLANLLIEAVSAGQQRVGVGVLGVAQNMGAAAALAAVTAVLQHHAVTANIAVMGRNATKVFPQVHTDNGIAIGFGIVTVSTLVALVIAISIRGTRTPATEEGTRRTAQPSASERKSYT